MKVSAKIDYACRALLELALHWPNNAPMQVSTIAKRQKVPMNFLVHILITLKEAGFVDSIRGKSGGYVLIKPPQEIRLGEVIKNFGGLGFSDGVRKAKNSHILDSVWQEIDKTVMHAVNDITLEGLCNRERNRGNTITYEI